jgi:hypothetical protein
MDALSRAVHDKGFVSVTAYADGWPVTSITELADYLGPDIEPLDLEHRLIAEAEATGTMERCARTLLARDLCGELLEGGAEHDDTTSRRLRLSGVFFALSMALPPAYHDAVDRIERAITSADLPSGWLPEGADDPVLIELFGSYWTPAVV